MGRSVLTYRHTGSRASGDPVLVVLHGHGGTVEQLLPLAVEVGPGFRILAPESPRPAYFMREEIDQETVDRGQTWYLSSGIDQIEPSTFGDSLAQLELFVRDVADAAPVGHGRKPSSIILLGIDQGAVLALSLMCIVPELVCGGVAINGYLPSISVLSEMASQASEQPVLAIRADDGYPPSTTLTNRTVQELDRLGFKVTAIHAEKMDPPQLLAPAIKDWLRDVVQAG